MWKWSIDTDNDGVPDVFRDEPAAADVRGIPIAGNFDGVANNGDEVGVFNASRWRFDTNRSFVVQDDPAVSAGYIGFPIVGDFDGDGDDDVGTYAASAAGGNIFQIDENVADAGEPIQIDGVADYSFRIGIQGDGSFGFPGVRERPVAADINADGIDDIGLWVPDGLAGQARHTSEWYFLVSDTGTSVLDRIDGGPFGGYVPFSPVDGDVHATFGNVLAVPVAGNFAAFHPTQVAVTPATAQVPPTPVARASQTAEASSLAAPESLGVASTESEAVQISASLDEVQSAQDHNVPAHVDVESVAVSADAESMTATAQLLVTAGATVVNEVDQSLPDASDQHQRGPISSPPTERANRPRTSRIRRGGDHGSSEHGSTAACAARCAGRVSGGKAL